MISIIIPVYNTEKYLPKCLESILEQDFTDYEIIAVNDGSTDGSLTVLENYALNDSRIIVIDKNNEGQGIARNIAIEKARGEFLLFVDSDDWLPLNALSLMWTEIKNTCADVVIGCSAYTEIDNENIAGFINEKVVGVIEKEQKKEAVFTISQAACPKLIRKSLFLDYEIKFPKIYFEDLATIPLIYALADKIAIISQCVYVQRYHSKSTVQRLELINHRISFVEYLVNGFKKLGLYEEYEILIKEYLYRRAQVNLRVVHNMTNRIYATFAEKQKRVFYENYGVEILSNKSVFCFGSYNLMIFSKIFMHLEDTAIVENYFGGSSIISCMAESNNIINQLTINHNNVFRRKCIINDIERHLLHMNPGNFSGNEFFFVDLLEERYNIGVYNGEYFTLSEAMCDILDEIEIQYDTIKRFTEKWWGIWESSCIRFIDKLRIITAGKPIVLIKTFLSERIFEDGNEVLFQNIEDIRYINMALEKCYGYFVKNCTEAIVIEISNLKEYGTDRYFRHGCYPWHLSAFGYSKIAEYIEDEIEKATMINK